MDLEVLKKQNFSYNKTALPPITKASLNPKSAPHSLLDSKNFYWYHIGKFSNIMNLRAIAIGTVGLIVTTITSEAGGFFGPPPFTNGSPLPSGVAGTYQATARGSGISGLLRFSYGTGGNPSTNGLNDYVFFFQGIMIKGSLQASIMDKKISGTMDAPTITGINPTVSDVQATGGFFNANIDTASPFYRFLGKGQLQTFVSFFDNSVVPPVAGPYVSQVRKFRVQGMRTSLNE